MHILTKSRSPSISVIFTRFGEGRMASVVRSGAARALPMRIAAVAARSSVSNRPQPVRCILPPLCRGPWMSKAAGVGRHQAHVSDEPVVLLFALVSGGRLARVANGCHCARLLSACFFIRHHPSRIVICRPQDPPTSIPPPFPPRGIFLSAVHKALTRVPTRPFVACA